MSGIYLTYHTYTFDIYHEYSLFISDVYDTYISIISDICLVCSYDIFLISTGSRAHYIARAATSPVDGPSSTWPTDRKSAENELA